MVIMFENKRVRITQTLLGCLVKSYLQLDVSTDPPNSTQTAILYTAAYKETVNVKVIVKFKVKKISNEKLQPHMNKHIL